MARPDHSDKIHLIKEDFRTGHYSQRDLAKKYGVSLGFVAKHTANLEKDLSDVVNAGIVYKQALIDGGEHVVNAVNAVIDEQLETLANIQSANALRSRIYKAVSHHALKKTLEAIQLDDSDALSDSMKLLTVGNTAILPVQKTLEKQQQAIPGDTANNSITVEFIDESQVKQ